MEFRNDLDLIVGDDQAKCVQLKTKIEGFESRLRKKTPVLIGHDMLFDPCFLHSTFVGALPALPRRGEGQGATGDVPQPFTHRLRTPTPASSSHRAGYDSYMTAMVFLRKSYLLTQTGERLWHIAAEDMGEEHVMRRQPPSAPPTSETHSSSTTVNAIPERGELFWNKYGNKIRVGLFGLILYIPKMADEEMSEGEE
ncbi:hypothetical protein DHEL01_v201122 [Diaporthe helianthi]|uniref:Uncharacterized protein n=1 Tax=Diaporthe helianthi TaxID=158607 RepID=A0A2P5ID97_DIAHE|nr:hypothetical protein DHEL01_v201122 [Diaporthe helianthi]